MTFKISHKDKARIDSVALALRGQTGKLDDAVRIFNEQLDAARVALGSAVGEYNEELGAAKNLMEDVYRQMQAEFEARSEKWRDGDEAEPVRAWISELETIYLGLAQLSLFTVPERATSLIFKDFDLKGLHYGA